MTTGHPTVDDQNHVLKVLLVAGSLPPDRCGVGDYTARLASTLSNESAINIEFIGSHTTGSFRADQPVARMDTWRLSSLSRLISIIRRSDADVVHVQYPTAGYDAIWLPSLVPLIARLIGKRAVSTFHEPQSWTSISHPRATLRFLLQFFGPGAIVTTRANFRTLLHPVLARLSARVPFRHIPIASNIGRSNVSESERQRLRAFHVGSRKRLIGYFGFVAPNKGIEDLLECIDREADQLLFIAALDSANPYHHKLQARLADFGRGVLVTGHLPADDVADLLSACDAVVLPFTDGASDTNGTIYAAALQGTYVLTTASDDRASDDTIRNIERVCRRDPDALRSALARHAGRRAAVPADADNEEWRSIAREHVRLYQQVVNR